MIYVRYSCFIIWKIINKSEMIVTETGKHLISLPYPIYSPKLLLVQYSTVTKNQDILQTAGCNFYALLLFIDIHPTRP